MRTIQLLVVSTVLLFMQPAHAGDLFTTDITLHLRGGLSTVQFSLDISPSETGTLVGDVTVTGAPPALRCNIKRKVAGIGNADGAIQFKTTADEGDDCIVAFKGTRQGADLAGSLKFLGKDSDVIFKKK